MTSPMLAAATGGSVLGSAIESALSQSQQLGQYGMVPTQTAGYSPAQLMGSGTQGVQAQQQQSHQSAGIATASGLTPESILQAYSGVQGELYNIPLCIHIG